MKNNNIHKVSADRNYCKCHMCKERRRQVKELELQSDPLDGVRALANSIAFFIYCLVAMGAVGIAVYALIWSGGGIDL